MSIYLRTLTYFRPFARETALAVVLMLIGIALGLLKPWPFKFLVDGLLSSEQSEGVIEAHKLISHWFGWTNTIGTVFVLCAAQVLISGLASVVNMLSSGMLIHTGLKALLHLRTELYSCLQALPLQFHDARRSSDSSFRVAYDSQSIRTIYNQGFSTIFNALVTLVSALAIMLAMNWRLTLVAIIVLPPLALAIRHYANRIRSESTAIHERESDLLGLAQEGLSSIRIVQAFGREAFEINQFVEGATRSLEANLRQNLTSLRSSLVIGAVMAVDSAIMYGAGSLEVLGGNLSLGDLLVFVAYLAMLYQPIEQLSYTAWALEVAAAGAQRCFEILDREEETKDSPDAVAITSARGELRFSGVAFAYDEKRPVLAGVDLTIAPGETLALIGGSGAGKSTLLGLAPRFYDPTAGVVRLDGHDIRMITKASLRAQIGMVLQDTLLFSTSVRENIAYGREGATEAEIVEAAKRAQAYDFIMSLPQGFETPVGERGAFLSVGQRQRIGIARAFLKNAPILLLDEPTSALDPSTEKAIMETISELMRGRTTFIVTHRVGIAHNLDRVILLEHGRIVEDGTGPSLLARGGSYERLYREMEAETS